jgi:hypothetical protein
MRKTAVLAGLFAIAAMVGLGSCDAMFDNNVFKSAGLGQLDVSKVDTSNVAAIADLVSSADALAKIKDQVSSGNSATRDAMLATLGAGPTVTKADMATALAADPTNTTLKNLALAATIQIKTSDAGFVVDNLVTQVANLTTSSGTGSTGPNMGTIVAAILPANIADQIGVSSTPPPEFVAMLQSISTASTIFTAVADSLAPATPGGTAGALPGVSNLTSQDLAFYGLASVAIDAVVPVDATQTKADALWAAVSNPNATTSPVTLDKTKFDTSTIGSSTTTTPVNTLLSAAGIDISAFKK